MNVFFETIIEVRILSEEPIHDCMYDLKGLHNLTYDGPCLAKLSYQGSWKLDKETVSHKLYEYGSEPSFFLGEDDD